MAVHDKPWQAFCLGVSYRVGHGAAVRVDNIDRLNDKGDVAVLGEHGHHDVKNNLGFGLKCAMNLKVGTALGLTYQVSGSALDEDVLGLGRDLAVVTCGMVVPISTA